VKIQPIYAEDWPQILEVQRQGYSDLEPESLEVLQSKWVISPSTCFVAKTNNDEVSGYLLSHPWFEDDFPKLGEVIATTPKTTGNLFLHDTCVSPNYSDSGIGSALVEYLLSIAKAEGFTSVTLISVQKTIAFWTKHGFTHVNNTEVNRYYGEGSYSMNLQLKGEQGI